MTQVVNPVTPNETGWWERLVAGWQRFRNGGFVKAMCALFDFIFNGHFILATGKWVALVGARTAVTVLFFASLWVAGESTVHPFMVQIVSHIPFVTTDTLDNLALTAFTWLPEIIVLEAILKTVFFAIDVIKNEKRVWNAIWGAIYLPLTGVFIYIAISTFMSYISTHAADQSNTGMLIFRALMAWMYSVIEMAYPAIYRKMYQEEAPTHIEVTTPAPATPQVDVEALISQSMTALGEKLQHENCQALDLFRVDQQRLLGKVQSIENSVPAINYDDLARAMLPLLQGHVRAILEENQSQSQSHPSALPEPEPQRQIEARATSRSHRSEPPAQSQGHQLEPVIQSQSHSNGKPTLTLVNSSKTVSEAEAKANGTPEERLQAAYDKLMEANERVSGRALAKLAHVNRGTASQWLGEVKGQQDDPDSEKVVDADCVVEAIAQGQ